MIDSTNGNVQTFLRIKPSKKPSGWFAQDEINQNIIRFDLPDTFKSEYVNNTVLNHKFYFDGIFPMNATQEQLFRNAGSISVRNALDGYNSTLFAYGQSGSGKTFTITGGSERYSDRGIIPRAIGMIFNELSSKSGQSSKIIISYLKIYNEQGYDLLNPKPSTDTKSLDDLQKINVLEDEFGNFHLKNLSKHLARNEEEALNLLYFGNCHQQINETLLNKTSSRSHCIFTISMEIRQSGSETVRRSKLHLVDLAGSVNMIKSSPKMVIVALNEKATKGRQHVPYRNSIMTSILKDSLGGNCKTIMIATINPEASHTEESLWSCRFAQRVSNIRNNALVNAELDPYVMIAKLKQDLFEAREDVARLREELNSKQARLGVPPASSPSAGPATSPTIRHAAKTQRFPAPIVFVPSKEYLRTFIIYIIKVPLLLLGTPMIIIYFLILYYRSNF